LLEGKWEDLTPGMLFSAFSGEVPSPAR